MTYGIVAALMLAQAAPAAPAAAASGGPILTLDEAMREAQAKNFDLKAARARLEQSKELSWKAWSSYLPQIAAAGTFTHSDFADVTFQMPTSFAIRDVGAPAVDPNPGLPGTPSQYALLPTDVESFVIQKQNQLGAQVQLAQALIAPQAWFGIGAARIGEQVAADTIENTRRQVLFGVAQAYYAAAGARQVVAIQERQLAIALAHENDARVRYQAGTAAKITLLRAEIDRTRSEQDLKRAQNGYASAKVVVATLLDRRSADFEVVVPPSPQMPASLDTLEQDAPRLRPDVQAADASVRLAERNRAGVVSRYAPALGAFARWQWANLAGFTGKESTFSLGLALTWTLLDGGLREAELRENGARIVEAEATRLGAEANAVEEVKRARLDLDSAVANREKAKEELALAQENQRLVNVNYQAGAATYLEVADANATLLSAALTQVRESLSADLAALRVLLAAGVFDPR